MTHADKMRKIHRRARIEAAVRKEVAKYKDGKGKHRVTVSRARAAMK